jgi:FMN phosphatase YigB (HAD superfamily)
MTTFMTNGPLDLVTFDLYDTLIELNPPRWERLATVARQQGIDTDPLSLRAADRLAEDYFTEENGRLPIRDRDAAARETFRLELMRRWLKAADLPSRRCRIITTTGSSTTSCPPYAPCVKPGC